VEVFGSHSSFDSIVQFPHVSAISSQELDAQLRVYHVIHLKSQDPDVGVEVYHQLVVGFHIVPSRICVIL